MSNVSPALGTPSFCSTANLPHIFKNLNMNNPKSEHNQPIADPIAHFKRIPWCAKFLSGEDVVAIQVPDRTPLASTER